MFGKDLEIRVLLHDVECVEYAGKLHTRTQVDLITRTQVDLSRHFSITIGSLKLVVIQQENEASKFVSKVVF